MDRGELRAELRGWLDDEASPPLWSDASLNRYINVAHAEAVQRAGLLQVAETLTTVAGTPVSFELDPEVWGVRSVVNATTGYTVRGTSVETLDERSPGWRTRSGDAQFFALDLSDPRDKRLVLSAVPRAVDTYTVTTMRHPTVMEDDGDEPEALVDTRLQLAMLHYAAALAYIRRDGDTQASGKRSEHEAAFTAAFGPPLTETQRRLYEERGDMVVRPQY